MMTYDPDLPGCFGPDLKFASGDRERDRAFRWLAKLRARRATWADARMQIEEFPALCIIRHREIGLVRDSSPWQEGWTIFSCGCSWRSIFCSLPRRVRSAAPRSCACRTAAWKTCSCAYAGPRPTADQSARTVAAQLATPA